MGRRRVLLNEAVAGEIIEDVYFPNPLKLAQVFRVIFLIAGRQVSSWKKAINSGCILCRAVASIRLSLFAFCHDY